jgi:catechol 2,3-dioxygenase-like lactoylglutathione lyase family enzyme
MTSTIRHITFDCHDLELVSGFWAELLGFAEDPDDPNEPGHTEYLIIDPKRRHPGLLFIQVPDEKVVKNRVHLDLNPGGAATAAERSAEIERILSLGGRRVEIGQRGDESWTVLADPEGNEFCVVRPKADLIGRQQRA